MALINLLITFNNIIDMSVEHKIICIILKHIVLQPAKKVQER